MQVPIVLEKPRGEIPLRLQACSTEQSKLRSWLWLAIAGILLMVANGVNTISLAAWLAPVFLLRFVRGQRLKIWLPAAYIVMTVTAVFQFRGMVPIPKIWYYLLSTISGVVLLLPYVLDRLVARKLRGLKASLVFTMTWVAIEYLMSRGPNGTWGATAYSQYGNLALLQILSVTGLWGVTFLIGWFATTCNWLWEERFDFRQARGAWLCLGMIVTVPLLGGIRMAFFPPSTPTVRVASLSAPNAGPQLDRAVEARMFRGRATNDDIQVFQQAATAVNNDMLARTEREMQTGARIVFWSEANTQILKEDEAAFVARGSNLAAKYHAYLGMALGVWNTKGKALPLENKLVIIEPDGHMAWQYNKAHPAQGPEASVLAPGDGRLRNLDTPYGRLSAVICFDGDFPQLLAQAGVSGTDVILDPANDWHAVDPWHTQMASFRAIEQGFNLVRQTSHGLSASFDYQGRTIASMDHFHTTDYVMVSQLPTKGVRTIYSRLGDWVAWLSLAGLACLTLLSLRKRAARGADEQERANLA